MGQLQGQSCSATADDSTLLIRFLPRANTVLARIPDLLLDGRESIGIRSQGIVS